MDTISGILTTLFVDSKKKFDENNDKNSNEINFSDIFTNYETKEENIEENKEKNDMKTLEILDNFINQKGQIIDIYLDKKEDLLKIVKYIFKNLYKVNNKNINKKVYINDNDNTLKKGFKKIIVEENDNIPFDEITFNKKSIEKSKTIILNIINNETDIYDYNINNNTLLINVYMFKINENIKHINIKSISDNYYISYNNDYAMIME
jgi:hypothetical protein